MKNHQNYQIENTSSSTFVIPKSCWINKIVGEFSLHLIFTFMIVCNQLLLLEPQLFLKRWFCHQFCNFRTSPQLNAFAKISFQQQSPGFHRTILYSFLYMFCTYEYNVYKFCTYEYSVWCKKVHPEYCTNHFFSTTTLQDFIIVVASIETSCSVEYEILII